MLLCNGRKNESHKQRRNYLFVLCVDDAGHREEYIREHAACHKTVQDADSLTNGVVANRAVSASHDEVPFLRNLLRIRWAIDEDFTTGVKVLVRGKDFSLGMSSLRVKSFSQKKRKGPDWRPGLEVLCLSEVHRRSVYQMTAQSQSNLEYKDADVKRDMDLVREVLIGIENDNRLDGTQFLRFALPDRDPHEVGYTVDRLIHAGLVTGSRDRRAHGQAPMVSGLTWEGHEFLDNIRDPGVWEETKERAKPLLSVSLAVLAELAKAEIKKRLGLP
jgi:hypothetical protein